MVLHKDPDVHEHSGVRDIPLRLHHTNFVAERSCAWLRDRAEDQQPFYAQISFPIHITLLIRRVKRLSGLIRMLNQHRSSPKMIYISGQRIIANDVMANGGEPAT